MDWLYGYSVAPGYAQAIVEVRMASQDGRAGWSGIA